MNPELAPDTPDKAPADAPASPSLASTPMEQVAMHKPVPQTATIAVGVVAAVALLTTGLLWQKVAGMQEQLARRSAEAQAQSLEARALARQAMSTAQDTAARAAVMDSRLSEVALQRSQLDELMQSMSRSRDENLVVDIEAALRLAQQQAQLTGSVEPLLAALKSADQRIVRAAQPRLALLQRAIARDIDRVKSSAVSDTPTMLIKLDELVRLADELVLVNAVAPARQSEKNLVAPPQPPVGWWQKGLQIMLGEARSLVRVSRIETPEAALLSPEQSFFLRENLKLKLLNARLGLLARQIESARSDLADAEAMMNKYFQTSTRKSQTAAALLQQVQTQMRTLQLPRVDDTLAVLATAAAGR